MDFFVAMLVAGVQVVLLKIVLELLANSKQPIAVLVVILKFIVYAVSISVLFRHFYPHVFRCFVGFIAGLPLFAILMYLVLFLLKIVPKRR